MWTQSEYDVTVTLKTPPGATKYDLSITMKRDSLRVYIKGKGAVIDNVLNAQNTADSPGRGLEQDTGNWIVLGQTPLTLKHGRPANGLTEQASLQSCKSGPAQLRGPGGLSSSCHASDVMSYYQVSWI